MTWVPFGSLGAVASTADAHLKKYIACVGNTGSIRKVFYLQDPSLEKISETHRRNDPCYRDVSNAIYENAKVLTKQLYKSVAGKPWPRARGGPYNSDIAKIYAAVQGRTTVGGLPFTWNHLKDIILEARNEAELEIISRTSRQWWPLKRKADAEALMSESRALLKASEDALKQARFEAAKALKKQAGEKKKKAIELSVGPGLASRTPVWIIGGVLGLGLLGLGIWAIRRRAG